MQSLSSAPSGQWGTPSQRRCASMQPPGGGQENWPDAQTAGLLVGAGRVPEHKINILYITKYSVQQEKKHRKAEAYF